LSDQADSGKSLVHKCAHVKSEMILEEIVETYRKVYVKLMTEQREEHAQKETKLCDAEE